MKGLYYNVIVLLVSISSVYSQSLDKNKHGFYLPSNIDECIIEFNKAFTQSLKGKFQELPESKIDKVFGVFIIGEWDDDSTSRTVRYFNAWRIYDWQERQYLSLLAFHRSLNHRSFSIAKEAGIIANKRDSLAEINRRQWLMDIVSD